jgi:hypothetical protein
MIFKNMSRKRNYNMTKTSTSARDLVSILEREKSMPPKVKAKSHEEVVSELKQAIVKMKHKMQMDPEIDDNYRMMALQNELGRILLVKEGKL